MKLEEKHRHRPKLTLDEIAFIRKGIPYGPLEIERINQIAGDNRIHPEYALKIASSSIHRVHDAYPRDHPVLQTLPPRGRPPKPNGIKRYSPLWRATKTRLGILQEWRCAYCFRIIEDNATVDHIVPISLGGPTSPHNLQITCRPCNQLKQNLSDEQCRIFLNRRQKRDHLKNRIRPFPKYGSIKRCSCRIHGCYPNCQGCELCMHRSDQPPGRVACPESPDPPVVCHTPSTCRTARACLQQQ